MRLQLLLSITCILGLMMIIDATVQSADRPGDQRHLVAVWAYHRQIQRW